MADENPIHSINNLAVVFLVSSGNERFIYGYFKNERGVLLVGYRITRGVIDFINHAAVIGCFARADVHA